MKPFYFFSILIFILVFLQKNSSSQDVPKGMLVIHIAPQNAIIYIDSVKQKNHAEVRLTQGKHVLKTWAPNCQLLNDTVSIIKDSTLVYLRKLTYTAEYSAYTKKKSGYVLARTIPPAVTVISTVVLAVSYSNNKKMMNQYYDKAKKSESSFYSTFAISTLDSSKTNFNQAKDSYETYRKKANSTLVAGAIILPICIGTSVYFFLRSKKPHYEETPLLTRASGNLFLTGSGGAGVYLSYKF